MLRFKLNCVYWESMSRLPVDSPQKGPLHYTDVIMTKMASQITSLAHHCLLNCLFRHRSKKTSKLCVTRLYAGNSPVISEFPAHRASNTEKCFHLMTASWPDYTETDPNTVSICVGSGFFHYTFRAPQMSVRGIVKSLTACLLICVRIGWRLRIGAAEPSSNF